MDIADVPNASLAAVRDGDKEAWLALFTEDAVVEDPVGSAPWDTPLGQEQTGKEAIGWYWDAFTQPQEAFDFEIHFQVVAGREVAAYATLRTTFANGKQGTVDCISIYTVDNQGLVTSLRSYRDKTGV
ncbi:nuclear transport factor 2 family protein [Enemella sp. A6]|uniref:nuclear transport factor 2 family protein n=1 Tax=Enemella sp. A6 TaxID=3440152 RepID=UPI003EBDA836